MRRMSKLDNFSDGRAFLLRSPFRSMHFLIVSSVGGACLVMVVYLLSSYKQILTAPTRMTIAVLIGLQIIYQWWRILRYYSRIRQLYSIRLEGEAKVETPLDMGLRIAAGGLIDMLFYCYGMTFVLLFVIGVLLSHVHGVKF
jgi:hypothetical protein